MERKARHYHALKEDGCDWNCRFRDQKGNCLMAQLQDVLVKLKSAVDRKSEPGEESPTPGTLH